MFYYIQKNNKILLYENEENLQLLKNSLEQPQYKDLEIQETTRNIIEFDGEFVFEDEVQYELAQERKQAFYTHFIKTSLGNYRLEPKGYANAQQAIDVVNNNVNTLGSLTGELTQWIIFYETPNFTKEEECTEKWLVAHQKNPEPMALEEWQKFYFEFCQLYAQSQYKK